MSRIISLFKKWGKRTKSTFRKVTIVAIGIGLHVSIMGELGFMLGDARHFNLGIIVERGIG